MMSKQSSNIGDGPEQAKRSGKSRKATPWVVWYMPGEETLQRFPGWREWTRMGRYATREIAEQAASRNGIADYCKDWRFRIVHESEGQPDASE